MLCLKESAELGLIKAIKRFNTYLPCCEHRWVAKFGLLKVSVRQQNWKQETLTPGRKGRKQQDGAVNLVCLQVLQKTTIKTSKWLKHILELDI